MGGFVINFKLKIRHKIKFLNLMSFYCANLKFVLAACIEHIRNFY